MTFVTFPLLVVSDPARWVSTEAGFDPAGPTFSHDFMSILPNGRAPPRVEKSENSWLKVGPAGSRPVSVDTQLPGTDTKWAYSHRTNFDPWLLWIFHYWWCPNPRVRAPRKYDGKNKNIHLYLGSCLTQISFLPRGKTSVYFFVTAV